MKSNPLISMQKRLKSFPLLCALLVPAMGVAGVAARGSTATAPQRRVPGDRASVKPSKADLKKAAKAYGELPMSFEPNQGQAPKGIEFVSRGQGYTLYLTPKGAVLGLMKPPTDGKPAKGQSAALAMRLVGANPKPQISGVDPLQGRTNYLMGSDQSKWRSNVPTFGKVRYQDVYPGVDMVYYGNQRSLEYDFVVAPGADPGKIRIAFQGADRVRLDGEGNLVVQVPGGSVEQARPVIYQEVAGQRKQVAGRFVVQGKQVSFQMAKYDATKPLVIDPILRYSSYLGGTNDDYGMGMTVDTTGQAYLTGYTGSFFREQNDTPTTFMAGYPPIPRLVAFPGAGGGRDQYSLSGDPDGAAFVFDLDVQNGPETPISFSGYDAFVTKFNESGTGLVYSTYLGAEDDDYGMAIAADSLGNAYITGLTRSFTFPLLRPLQAFQERTGGGDAFVTKLTPAGNLAFDASRPSTEQPFSTYLGGGGRDVGRSITVDPLGNTIVTGLTDSLNLLANRQVVFPPFQPNYGGGARDQFVGVINLSAAAFNYLTYLGGDGDEGGLGPDTGDIPYGIAIGVHTLPNPTRTFPGFFSGPLANKFGPDFGAGVVTDPQGNAYVVGGTNSQNFFTTPGAFQRTPGGDNDAFVTKFNTSGQPIFSTLLGGSGNDGARGVAVDTNRNIYITGYTASGNFPTAGSTVFQAANAGGLDAFLTKMNVDGAGLAYSTYLGGSGNDIGYSVAVNTTFNPYVVGNTTSPDFPRSDQIQGSLLGGRDMFVTKFIPEGSTQEYSTYLGGFFQDFGNAVGIDPRGGIIVYGSTWEDNALSSFPSTLGTFQQRMIPPFAGRFYGRIAPYGRSNTRSDFGEYPLVDAVVVRITNAPLQPTNLRVVAGSITESGVVLEWDDNSINETGFVIERSENGGAFVRIGSANNPTVGENVTRFEDTGRKPDTRYSYRVAAVNADGLSAYSNQIDIRTLPIPPAAPTNLQATSSLTPTPRVTLTFTDTSTDETGFRVEKSTNGTTFTTLTTLSPNTTTYVDTAVEVGRTYSYRVRAVRLTAGGITAVSGPTNTVTITLTAPPATPVLVSAIATGPEQVTLTFTDTSTDEQGFRIQRSEGNGAFVQVGQTGPGQTTFVDNSVDAESTYRYRVVAFNSSGVGNPSNILSVTTPGFPPAAPSRLTAVVTSNRSIELRWSFGGDADVFEVQRRAAAEQEFTAIGTAAGNTRTFTDPNVSPNVTYEYRVVARNENGDSNPSNTASARITTGGKLQVRPPRLNFGRFTRGATASLTFTIRNAGRGTLSGVVDQPDPQSNIPFFISQGAGTFTLAPRGTKRITVQFTSIPGRHEGVVQIRASDRSRPFQVRLTAVGQ